MKSLKTCLAFAICALALSGCATTVGSSPKGLEAPIEKAAMKYAADVKEGGYKVIGTEELKRWLDQGKSITLISALPTEDDQRFGIIPGAVNGVLPKSEKELTAADRSHLLQVAGADKTKPVVIYCGFVACRRSHIGAKLLVEDGFQNVYRYPGGIIAWQQAGYPVTK
jgi:rhodanese-related sulfurtransferase